MTPTQGSLTLGVFPYYPNNPWQELIYSELRADGVTILPVQSLEDSSWVRAAHARGDEVALHINWTAPVSQVGSIGDASARVARAITTLDELNGAGVTTIWTVHNVLPHDARHLLPEVLLCRALAEKTDLITIINPGTRRAVLPWYRLPAEKVVELPHPSYRGTYPDDVTRAQARGRWGIAPSERVLLLLGTLRPYKGIEEAVAAMPEVLGHLPDTRLLISGEIGPGYDEAALRAIVADAAGVDLHIGYVPDAEIQWWMRAADAMLLPYRAGLNSAVLMLAADFGLPVIMSDSEASRGLADASWVHMVPAGQELSAGVLDGLRTFATGDPSAEALKAARAHEPTRISRLFASQVRTAVAGRAVGRAE